MSHLYLEVHGVEIQFAWVYCRAVVGILVLMRASPLILIKYWIQVQTQLRETNFLCPYAMFTWIIFVFSVCLIIPNEWIEYLMRDLKFSKQEEKERKSTTVHHAKSNEPSIFENLF